MLHILQIVVRKLGSLVERGTTSYAYPTFVGLTALAFTISMSIPFGSVQAVAVLLDRRRWRAISLWSSVGSSVGAVAIYLAFHHWGWAQFVEAYPDTANSKGWQDATTWVSRYGAYALFVIAALPLPQTPALMFASIYRMPVLEVWLAILLGKLFKYGLYGGIVAKFPRHFSRRHALLLEQARLRDTRIET